MIPLDSIKSSISNLLSAVSGTYHLEAAVFDSRCTLISCTPKYLQMKGKSVHSPSLEEVMQNGDVLVNKPGFMPSCIGCRFKDHCPSTIEILNSINYNGNPIGVISLATFTDEGQKRLNKNLDTYVEILHDISELIALLAVQKKLAKQLHSTDKTLQSVMELSHDCYFVLDNQGTIKSCNTSAFRLFPQCDMYPKSLERILPEELLSEVMAGRNISNRVLKKNSIHAVVSSLPIVDHNQFDGAVVKISQDNGNIKQKSVDSPTAKHTLDYIKGHSPSILTLKDKVKKIAGSSSTVLIYGETGTGKELFAKAIHHNSSRSAFPFLSINCASIPETLFESELFGYEEGAFTGAKKGGKPGCFELANGGTLFLDEIGEMPLYMQAKLLRVLQDYAILRVGGTHIIPVDVRIIAATNQRLEEMIEKKIFRSDLYYRLNVIPLSISPLRFRKEDIPILAMHFLDKYCIRLNKQIQTIEPEVMALLHAHEWPGNVRELENVIEYAVNMEGTGALSLCSMPEGLINRKQAAACLEVKEKIKNIEEEAIRNALAKFGWDVKGKTLAAKELGIGLRTLYRKLDILEPNKR